MIFLKNLSKFSKESILKAWDKNVPLWIIFMVLSFISIIILILWIYQSKKLLQVDRNSFYVEDIKRYDSEVLNFFITFIIPIESLNVSSWPSVTMNLILVIIEGIYYISNNALYFNVILLILGYHIYSFDDDKIILSRNRISTVKKNGIKQLGTTNLYYS